MVLKSVRKVQYKHQLLGRRLDQLKPQTFKNVFIKVPLSAFLL